MLPIKPKGPLSVEIKLTNACNLRCQHCIGSCGNSNTSELSSSEVFSIIDELAAIPVFYIGFTGGEPLLCKAIFDYIAYAKERGLKVGLTTNGTLLSTQNAQKLKASGLWLLRISLDSHDAHTHDALRGVEGAHEAALKGIRSAREASLPVTVLSVFSKLNSNQLPELLQLCDTLDVSGLNAFTFVPAGRGIEHRDWTFSPQEYRGFLENVLALQKHQSKTRIVSETPLLEVLRSENLGEVNEDNSGGCLASTFALFIMENGDVRPCPYFGRNLGNTRDNSIQHIWKHRAIPFLERLLELDPACSKCKFVNCCQGGCRAAADHVFGTTKVADPYCWIKDGR